MIYFDQEDPGPRCRAPLSLRLRTQRITAQWPPAHDGFCSPFFSSSWFVAFSARSCSQRLGAQSSSDESALRDDLRSFTSVYDLVEQNYAEPLTGDKAEKAIYDGAIPGMLRVLDPHSSFYDPKAYAKMREDQHGKYYGVGMLIQPQKQQDCRGKSL